MHNVALGMRYLNIDRKRTKFLKDKIKVNGKLGFYIRF